LILDEKSASNGFTELQKRAAKRRSAGSGHRRKG
jgi:hypothetical protein